jgi:hypothetical protein
MNHGSISQTLKSVVASSKSSQYRFLRIQIWQLHRILNSPCDLCEAIAHSVDLLLLLLTTCSAHIGAVAAEVHVATPGRESREFTQDIIEVGQGVGIREKALFQLIGKALS